MMDDSKKHAAVSEQDQESLSAHQQEGAAVAHEQALVQCRQELQGWKEDCLRSRAEFENFKRRVERERIQWTQLAQNNILKDFLAVLDDFERGLAYVRTASIPAEVKAWVDGMRLTYDQFKKVLLKHGVTEIAATQTFDPSMHEAVMYVPSAEHPAGHIVQVLQKGYMLKNEMLRPAKVSVSQGDVTASGNA